MPTMIKDLKRMAAGTEVVGIALAIKVGRKAERDPDGSIWQSVVFIDSSGELPGRILLADNAELGEHKDQAGYHIWKTKEHISIMRGEMQDADERKKDSEKLVVFECFDAEPPLSFDQKQEWQNAETNDYHEQSMIQARGKIRHWEVVAYQEKGIITPLMSDDDKAIVKQSILYWQNFVETGE